jgi:hypothetical protein
MAGSICRDAGSKPVNLRRIVHEDALPQGLVRRPFAEEVEEVCLVRRRV